MTIMIVIITIIVLLYSTHIHYLPEILYKTIPKNYNFTVRNLKNLKTSKISKKTLESKRKIEMRLRVTLGKFSKKDAASLEFFSNNKSVLDRRI